VSKSSIFVLHGPNLDRLGGREPELYGHETLAQIDRSLIALGASLGLEVECFQSAHEGVLIDRIHAASDAGVAGFLCNPGGLGPSSVSLRDAFLACGLPLVEVHCSNIAAREEFRRETLLSDVAVGCVSGFGGESYRLGLRGLAAHLKGA